MKFIFQLVILLNSAVLFSQAADFSFDKTTKNYGVITEGDTLKGYFVYKNIGKEPLKISKYTVECHCTELHYPNVPTKPMASDTLFFTFDSQGKSYQQDRTILIYANTKKEMNLVRFKVYVNPK
jgi:hypothetical protein